MNISEIIADLLSAGSIRGAIKIAPTDEHPEGCQIIIQGASQENATHADAYGEPVMVWVYEKPIDPATAAQQQQRSRITFAAWAVKTLGMTTLQRVITDAAKHQITPQQAAMKDVLRHPDFMGTPWDYFISVWDAGATRWQAPDGIVWDAGISWFDDGATAWT